MKKIAVAVVILTFVFTSASICLAANEFQIKGTVTNINGNKLTIKDDKDKETTVEGDATGIKTGDKVLVTVTIKLRYQRDKLTAEDVDFLSNRCQIDRADMDIIPQLQEDGRGKLCSFIDRKDCDFLVAFKASRNYYRQLQYDKPIPLPPAGWDVSYLTTTEFKRYLDILDKAPW